MDKKISSIESKLGDIEGKINLLCTNMSLVIQILHGEASPPALIHKVQTHDKAQPPPAEILQPQKSQLELQNKAKLFEPLIANINDAEELSFKQTSQINDSVFVECLSDTPKQDRNTTIDEFGQSNLVPKTFNHNLIPDIFMKPQEKEKWEIELGALGENTQRMWRGHIKRFIAFKSEQDSGMTIDGVVKKFLSSKHNQDTYNGYASAINFYFKQEGIIAKKIKLKKKLGIRNPKIATEKVRNDSFEHAKENPAMFGLFLLISGAAMRIGDLQGIKWETQKKDPDGFYTMQVLGKNGLRDAYFTENDLQYLIDNRKEIEKFVSKKPNNIRNMLKRWATKEGIEYSNPHSFRHARISEISQSSLSHARDVAGHTSINTTNFYISCLERGKNVNSFGVIKDGDKQNKKANEEERETKPVSELEKKAKKGNISFKSEKMTELWKKVQEREINAAKQIEKMERK